MSELGVGSEFAVKFENKFAFAFECLLPPVGGGAWGARSRPVPAGIGQGYVGEVVEVGCGSLGMMSELGVDSEFAVKFEN